MDAHLQLRHQVFKLQVSTDGTSRIQHQEIVLAPYGTNNLKFVLKCWHAMSIVHASTSNNPSCSNLPSYVLKVYMSATQISRRYQKHGNVSAALFDTMKYLVKHSTDRLGSSDGLHVLLSLLSQGYRYSRSGTTFLPPPFPFDSDIIRRDCLSFSSKKLLIDIYRWILIALLYFTTYQVSSYECRPGAKAQNYVNFL